MSARRKILFLDRDGTLLVEPPDHQVDSYEKFDLVEGAIPALLRLRDAGYAFVMVSNQDGLGGPAYPRASFDAVQGLLLRILASQGIAFEAVHIDASRPDENADTRKPRIGMMLDYLRRGDLDFASSAVIGDRDTDLEFARNLGVAGFKLGAEGLGWAEIAHRLADRPRRATLERATRETRIQVELDLDRDAPAEIRTGIGFFDHMLEQLGRHGGFWLRLRCAGDLGIDEHHTVEDCALALGAALRDALGDKRGLARYGFSLPMDDASAHAMLDLSGRSYFTFAGAFPRERIGELPTELVPHFFRSLCEGLGANLQLSVAGENAHHMVEACFKATARALRMALRREGRELPSTKGVL
jgi:imidazoleglycerol-phosphate dehydratase/histidinol-phosphatase